MFGGLTNLPGLFKQAKELQERMATLQQEIAARRFQGDAGGGTVVVTVDGRGMLVDVKIQPDAVADVELLEDMIKGAAAVANNKAQDAARAEMAQLTGGMNIPGLSEMFGGA